MTGMCPPPSRLASLLLATLAGGSLVSCTSDYSPDGNMFLNDRAPRYGYGGTDAPRYKYGATETEAPSEPRGQTRYLNERRERREEPRRPALIDEPEVSGEGGPPEPTTETTEAPPRRLEPTAEPEPPAPEPKPEPAPEPKPKPPPSEDIPYATPVPGQEGKVYSPFHNGGYVDVSGMPSGSKARCPYTKKIFRVP